MRIINKLPYLIILFFAVSSMLIEGCKKNDEITSPNPNATTASKTARDSAVADYNTNYLGSNITNTGWTGNTATCDAGTVPQATSDAVIARINYFRRLVGLNSNCTLDVTKFSQEQETA